MQSGQVFFGAVCQAVGAFFVRDQRWYAASLWLGIVFSLAASAHMARTLDRALQMGDAAVKAVTRGYLFRYVMICLVLALSALTKTLNPLVVFLGYMSMKVAAYLQPFTHKALNRLFHETDPVLQPLPEQDGSCSEEHAADSMESLHNS